MDDTKDYHEVFYKDDRNKRGTDNAKKRNNAKEAAHRLEQQLKRNGEMQSIDDSSDQEPDQKQQKKYGNGKAKKVQKQQTFWVDEPTVDTKNGKKNKKK